MLVPETTEPAFGVARAVEGVPGWRVKSLEVALAEVAGYCEETGASADELLSVLARAQELCVGVVVGERGA